MKYLLTLYDTASAPSEGVTSPIPQRALMPTDDFRHWCDANNVEILVGEQVFPAETATTLRLDAGVWVVTDGPIHASDVRLNGLVVIKCEHADLALAAARQIPNQGACELRPIIG